MAMRKRVSIARRKPVEEAEIVVIPMIDVMMFLLFFFMVASLAMVVQNALPVNLPKAATADSSRSQNITITIMRGATEDQGRIFLNTREIPMAQLADGLKALQVSKDNTVTINADKRVEYDLVAAAMDEARKAGIVHFALATDRG